MRYSLWSALLIVLAATAIASCPAVSSPAEARGHHHQYRQHHRHHHLHGHFGHHHRERHQTIAALHVCHRWHCGSFRTAWHGNPRASRHTSRAHRGSGVSSTSLASVNGTLNAKAHEIVASCGSTVISAFRAGARIAGSGHASMHASGRAVDIRGNPGCIYSHLHGWAGGYSTDYDSVQHVHVSLGGREDGLRFSHHSSRHAHRRRGSHRARGHALDAASLHPSG